MNVSVILPSFDPGEKLPATVKRLTAAGFDDIILINDGSRSESLRFLEEAAALPNVTLLTHSSNMGKGRALKTGFEYFLETRSGKDGVITVDDDLQQDISDVIACGEKMVESGGAVLGARSFKNGKIPVKSRIGNAITLFTFRFLCGIKISDTQTGLRALPASYLPTLTKVSGEGFEYETNMLLEMKRNGLKFTEIPIKVIYSDNNRGTRFRPIKDSVKIYSVILKYLISSLSSSLIDLILFTILNLILPLEENIRVFIATAAARLVSSLFNYAVNRRQVFKSGGGSSIVKYYILSACQMGASYGLVYLITLLTSSERSFLQTLFKMIIDVVLFFFCFTIQREWVFKEKRSDA